MPLHVPVNYSFPCMIIKQNSCYLRTVYILQYVFQTCSLNCTTSSDTQLHSQPATTFPVSGEPGIIFCVTWHHNSCIEGYDTVMWGVAAGGWKGYDAFTSKGQAVQEPLIYLQCHIQDNFNLWQQHCKNLKSCNLALLNNKYSTFTTQSHITHSIMQLDNG